jgi:aminopeptidase S
VDAAAWATFNANLNSFAGQTVYILIEASDNASGSLVEAAVDNVRITSN